jgi:N-acyl-D-aspartate/D-glutamate deacylase
MIKKSISRGHFIKSTAKAGIFAAITAGLQYRLSFSSLNNFDLIIKNGLVIDGINDKPNKSDLGIIDDRIDVVGNLDSANSKSIIDAADKIVSPGFVDIHSHTDIELLINPKAESKIRQGITTELSGNCGFSSFPRKKTLSPFEKDLQEKISLDFDWTDLERYHFTMEKRGLAVNHATLIG